MGGDDHRHPLLSELPDHLEDLGDELRVERARDLVEKHDGWPHRQSPHDRDTLLLATREPVRVLVPFVAQTEALEQRRGTFFGCLLVDPKSLARRERDVAQHGHVREEVERLEHDPDPPPHPVDVDATSGDLLAADDDPARVDGLEEIDASEQRRFARSRSPDQANDLVLANFHVNPAQDVVVSEGLVDALDKDAATAGSSHRANPASRLRRSRAIR